MANDPVGSLARRLPCQAARGDMMGLLSPEDCVDNLKIEGWMTDHGDCVWPAWLTSPRTHGRHVLPISPRQALEQSHRHSGRSLL